MSIWAVRLSEWIDKDDPKCYYKSYIKTMLSIKKVCSNPLCNKRVGYGMIDLHSAPMGHGDGVVCSWQCHDQRYHYEKSYKPSKRTLKIRKKNALNMVAWLQADTSILTDERKKQLPREHGVTQEEVDEYVKTWNGVKLIDIRWKIFERKYNKKKGIKTKKGK